MSKPNIVLMVADDMGYGDFGVFNDGKVRTPTLDRLIAGGTCLSQHYAGSPVCSPSRAALLTGRFGTHTGVIGHGPTACWLSRNHRRQYSAAVITWP